MQKRNQGLLHWTKQDMLVAWVRLEEPTGFAGGLDDWCGRRRRGKDGPQVSGWRTVMKQMFLGGVICWV